MLRKTDHTYGRMILRLHLPVTVRRSRRGCCLILAVFDGVAIFQGMPGSRIEPGVPVKNRYSQTAFMGTNAKGRWLPSVNVDIFLH